MLCRISVLLAASECTGCNGCSVCSNERERSDCVKNAEHSGANVQRVNSPSSVGEMAHCRNEWSTQQQQCRGPFSFISKQIATMAEFSVWLSGNFVDSNIHVGFRLHPADYR